MVKSRGLYGGGSVRIESFGYDYGPHEEAPGQNVTCYDLRVQLPEGNLDPGLGGRRAELGTGPVTDAVLAMPGALAMTDVITERGRAAASAGEHTLILAGDSAGMRIAPVIASQAARNLELDYGIRAVVTHRDMGRPS